MPEQTMPGGRISSRPLRFYWVLDVSQSMSRDGKIGQLNFAIREAIPAMRAAADENPEVSVEIKVLTFASGFKWWPQEGVAVSLDDFKWTDVDAGGVTDMGAALKALATDLSEDKMPARGLPPVVVLVTDGQPSDDFETGLAVFMAQPWCQRTVRIGIAIGEDADRDVIRKFIGNPEVELLEANNSEALVQYIRWVSTTVLKTATAPPIQPPKQASSAQSTSSTNIPAPPPPAPPLSSSDVW